MADKYSKLDKTPEYDQEAANQLAEALNEINELHGRISQLQDLVSENTDLHPFVWRTADGKAIAVHNLEDDHLSNILRHLVGNGRSISVGIRAEARKRNLLIPHVEPGVDPRRLLAADQTDREDW